jgi:hypothetical protein
MLQQSDGSRPTVEKWTAAQPGPADDEPARLSDHEPSFIRIARPSRSAAAEPSGNERREPAN